MLNDKETKTFWLAAIWAFKSAKLSRKFRDPEQPEHVKYFNNKCVLIAFGIRNFLKIEHLLQCLNCFKNEMLPDHIFLFLTWHSSGRLQLLDQLLLAEHTILHNFECDKRGAFLNGRPMRNT